jgi:16S rRNA C967 or C1407 C5-methylase (RsmB/RsmF family)/NOL1/NOP2/fmu family ribosome biogenesis protein
LNEEKRKSLMDEDHKSIKLAEKINMAETAGVKLPFYFLERMKLKLRNDFGAFMDSFLEDTPVAIRLNPEKWKGDLTAEKVPWCSNGYYLEKRPVFTTDPWFHGGAYYVQEPHSMFLEQAIKTADLRGKALVLDLCAAPGGKTTHLLSLYRPSDLVVANEVIRSRSEILLENVRKWGYPNIVVTQNDPKDFAGLGELFDLIVVDAPCSGEGLFRKDTASAGEWSLQNTELCASRQKRILAEAWKCLKPGGYLIYSTCTYNPAENEENLAWLEQKNEAISVRIPLDMVWNIREIHFGNITGYRFFPHLSKGEGFFLGMVRKRGELEESRSSGKYSMRKWAPAPRKTGEKLSGLISGDLEGDFLLNKDKWHFFPGNWMKYLSLFEKKLNIIQAGTPVASGDESRLIPHPALPLATVFNPSAFPEVSLDLPGAISYLRKENLPPMISEKGWMTVSYSGIRLGWLKNLGNRTNNYYPMEWRIRMNINELPMLWHESKG